MYLKKKWYLKLFIILIAVITACIFTGCMTAITQRANAFVPMEESCILTTPEDIPYGILRLEGSKTVNLGNEYNPRVDKKVIIPAGKYIILANIPTSEETGTNVFVDRWGKETRSPQTSWFARYYCGVFDLEPGAEYAITHKLNVIKEVKPAETENAYIDDDGIVYPWSISQIYYMDPALTYIERGIPRVDKDHKYDSKYTYFIFPIECTKTDGKLDKTYFAPEYAGMFRAGLMNPLMVALQFGNTYGMVYYSNYLNFHLNAEWGLGIGIGAARYDFSGFEAFINNAGGGLPINLGITTQFDISKFNFGFGGGYLLTPFPPQGILGTPYVQATINNFFYIDYYFTPNFEITQKFMGDYAIEEWNSKPATPPYFSFGLGVKYRL